MAFLILLSLSISVACLMNTEIYDIHGSLKKPLTVAFEPEETQFYWGISNTFVGGEVNVELTVDKNGTIHSVFKIWLRPNVSSFSYLLDDRYRYNLTFSPSHEVDLSFGVVFTSKEKYVHLKIPTTTQTLTADHNVSIPLLLDTQFMKIEVSTDYSVQCQILDHNEVVRDVNIFETRVFSHTTNFESIKLHDYSLLFYGKVETTFEVTITLALGDPKIDNSERITMFPNLHLAPGASIYVPLHKSSEVVYWTFLPCPNITLFENGKAIEHQYNGQFFVQSLYIDLHGNKSYVVEITNPSYEEKFELETGLITALERNSNMNISFYMDHISSKNNYQWLMETKNEYVLPYPANSIEFEIMLTDILGVDDDDRTEFDIDIDGNRGWGMTNIETVIVDKYEKLPFHFEMKHIFDDRIGFICFEKYGKGSPPPVFGAGSNIFVEVVAVTPPSKRKKKQKDDYIGGLTRDGIITIVSLTIDLICALTIFLFCSDNIIQCGIHIRAHYRTRREMMRRKNIAKSEKEQELPHSGKDSLLYKNERDSGSSVSINGDEDDDEDGIVSFPTVTTEELIDAIENHDQILIQSVLYNQNVVLSQQASPIDFGRLSRAASENMQFELAKELGIVGRYVKLYDNMLEVYNDNHEDFVIESEKMMCFDRIAECYKLFQQNLRLLSDLRKYQKKESREHRSPSSRTNTGSSSSNRSSTTTLTSHVFRFPKFQELYRKFKSCMDEFSKERKILNFVSKRVYLGKLVNGKMHGKGRIFQEDNFTKNLKRIFEGNFKNDEKDGRGVDFKIVRGEERFLRKGIFRKNIFFRKEMADVEVEEVDLRKVRAGMDGSPGRGRTVMGGALLIENKDLEIRTYTHHGESCAVVFVKRDGRIRIKDDVLYPFSIEHEAFARLRALVVEISKFSDDAEKVDEGIQSRKKTVGFIMEFHSNKHHFSPKITTTIHRNFEMKMKIIQEIIATFGYIHQENGIVSLCGGGSATVMMMIRDLRTAFYMLNNNNNNNQEEDDEEEDINTSTNLLKMINFCIFENKKGDFEDTNKIYFAGDQTTDGNDEKSHGDVFLAGMILYCVIYEKNNAFEGITKCKVCGDEMMILKQENNYDDDHDMLEKHVFSCKLRPPLYGDAMKNDEDSEEEGKRLVVPEWIDRLIIDCWDSKLNFFEIEKFLMKHNNRR